MPALAPLDITAFCFSDALPHPLLHVQLVYPTLIPLLTRTPPTTRTWLDTLGILIPWYSRGITLPCKPSLGKQSLPCHLMNYAPLKICHVQRSPIPTRLTIPLFKEPPSHRISVIVITSSRL
jgi:hypothetical protein